VTACVDRLVALFVAALPVNILTGIVGSHGREPHARGLRMLQALIERAAIVGIGCSP
jgi:hypothetical protein